MDILDQILGGEMANEYTDSKGGYTKGLTLTYDGNKEGKKYFTLGDSTFVRIGGAIDAYDIKTVSLNDTVIPVSELQIVSSEQGTSVYYSGVIGIAVFYDNNSGVPAGTYVLDDGEYVITKVVTETIVPIDPKFIPGAVLPVVEIANIVEITETEATALDAVAEKKSPIVLNCDNLLGYSVSIPMMYAYNNSSAFHSYVAMTPFGEVSIANPDGVWQIVTA